MKSLPSYQELKAMHLIHAKQAHFIEKSRQTVRAILNGIDPRLLLIVGPCSIHDPISAQEFAERISLLAKEVTSQFFILMRVYCEKPRSALGWKGFLYDPLLDNSDAMASGIEWTRKLFLKLADLEVPAATEFLDPLTAFYYDDLITWGSIGARTASSQIHRNLASALEMPIGFKNGVAGNISAAIQGVVTAMHPHTYMCICPNGRPTIFRSSGNADAHVVLRGGETNPNFDSDSVALLLNSLKQANLPLRLLIDCAHGNSGKDHTLQTFVFDAIIQQIIEGNKHIRGLMLESHLVGGNQLLTADHTLLRYGQSITDPCLDLETTVSHILHAAKKLHQKTYGV